MPDLSRDGKRLAFVARRPGTENEKEELWIKSLEDGRETLLAADGLSRYPPRWSRDGKRLAYRRIRPLNPEGTKGESSIVVMPAGGEDEQVITSVVGVLGPPYDWSSDDQWLLASCYHDQKTGGPFGMCLYPLSAAPYAEREMRGLAFDPKHNFWQMRFSPDERWISFCATPEPRNFTNVIGVMPASGGPWTQVTEDKFWADKPRWSPDGKIIYFLSNRNTTFFDVYGIHFDPDAGKPIGEIFQVTKYENPNYMVSPYILSMEISLSETRLILPVMQVTGSIWMLDNVDR